MGPSLVLLGICILGAEDEKVTLKEAGIALPRAIAKISYQNRQDYEGKGLGYSVNYANRMCRISLYVYDREQKEIPDGKAAEAVGKELQKTIEELHLAEQQGVVKNLKGMKEDPPLLADVRSTFATAGFTFDVKGGGCKSYILLVGHKRHFFKVRVTQYVVENKTNDEEVKAFLTAIMDGLKKSKD
jgi:hypothetical protein